MSEPTPTLPPADSRTAWATPHALEAMRVGELKAAELLDVLVRRATQWRDPVRRSRELTALNRLLVAEGGVLEVLQDERARAIRERVHDHGEPRATVARDLGVSTERVRQLLDDGLTDEDRAERWERRSAAAASRVTARQERDAAHRAAVTAREAERAAAGAGLLDRFEAGEPAKALAAELGVSRQAVTALITAARRAREGDGR